MQTSVTKWNWIKSAPGHRVWSAALFGTATHILVNSTSGSYGIWSCINLTSQRGKQFSYVAWHYENVRSWIRSFILILSLLLLVGFFFYLTSCKTGNQVGIMGLFLLVWYCVHYAVEYLHLWYIPAQPTEFLTHQLKYNTMLGLNRAFYMPLDIILLQIACPSYVLQE